LGATDRPYFRTDLVSRPIEDAGHRFIEVTDPDSGHSFRFYEIEYAIACAMDGERDVDGLVDWARIELGLEPSSDELRTVISTLGELGYLEGTVPRVAERPAERTAEPAPLDRPPPAGRTAVPPGPALGPSPFDFGMDAPIATPVSGRGVGDLPSDLSTDLSQHSPVRAADVQEAVRQSRAIPVARPPENTATDDDDFDEQQTPVPMGGPARAPAAAAAGVDPFTAAQRQPATPPPAQLSPSLQKTLMGTGPAVPSGGFGGRAPTPPMVLPEQPSDFNPSEFGRAGVPGGGPARPTAASRPAAMGRDARDSQQAPPPQSVSAEMPMFTAKRPTALLPYLIVLLLLSAAGAAAYWWFFIHQPDDGEGAETVNESPPVAQSAVEPSQPAAAGQPVPAAPEPIEVTATLEAGPAQEQEVLSPRAGRVAWVAESGVELAEGAAVAKFDGFQTAEYAVKEAQDSQRNYQEKLDQATAKGDKEAMKTAEGNVKRKQRDIDRRTAELDELLIKAQVGGVVEPSIKPRTSVTKDQPVAKILAQSDPRATFALPAGQSHTAPQAQVVSKADPGLRATCKVEASEPGKLVVSCPTDSGLASGTQIVLTPP
jgi:hypothetical protein